MYISANVCRVDAVPGGVLQTDAREGDMGRSREEVQGHGLAPPFYQLSQTPDVGLETRQQVQVLDR